MEVHPLCPQCGRVIDRDDATSTCPYCSAQLFLRRGPVVAIFRTSYGVQAPTERPPLAEGGEASCSSVGDSILRMFLSFRSRRGADGGRADRRRRTTASLFRIDSDVDGPFFDHTSVASQRPESNSGFDKRKSHSMHELMLPPIESTMEQRTTPPGSSLYQRQMSDSSTSPAPPILSVAQLKASTKTAKKSKRFDELYFYYAAAFGSFADITKTFSCNTKRGKTSGSNIDHTLVQTAYSCLMELPVDLQKAVLKAVINCLLTDQRNLDVILARPVTEDNLKAYVILIQNPQFRKTSTYVVFAHLLRQIATLSDADQMRLSEWLTELNPTQTLPTITVIQQFINIRLYPPKPQELPPLSKCSWWVPCAIKTLAIFNIANNSRSHNSKKSLDYHQFYNEALDHWDLVADFYQWQTPNLNAGFLFCHYPFILSIKAKKLIMDGHAEQQMIANARDSIIGNLAMRRTPDMDMIFFNIVVRRTHLLEDSLTELSSKQGSLRKKLKVRFAGEPGLDMGGLTKEWFQLLTRRIFHPDYGMFTYHRGADVYWFSTNNAELDNILQEYHLIGTLMGLAVYNGVILDIRFPLCCFRKLLSPAVVPRILDVRSTPLGIVNATVDDLAQIMPDTARGLNQLLSYAGDIEEDFGLNFQITIEEFAQPVTVALKKNGENIPVTNENAAEYVKLYVDWLINQSVERQFKAFYLGFHSVCSSNVLLLMREEEIELLVCGDPKFDLAELRRVTTYDGYKANDKTIRYFWDLILKLPEKHQKRLLLFVTGSDRIPAAGMREMAFKITKMPHQPSGTKMLPVAHTCFNQLVLPDYQNRHLLKHKLAVALAHGEGFGIE